jgi:hypothetical protein
MPRLVQYWMRRSSAELPDEVGPPWHLTTSGGFSPAGAA